MDNAWLDSLSEDWISQPRSTGSPARSPVESLSGLPASSPTSESQKRHSKSSRIPLPHLKYQSISKLNGSQNMPLSERSSNDLNVPLPQSSLRQPSKLRKEMPNSSRGRRLSRTVSESTTGSVQHHTVQHKSLSSSPQKLRAQDDIPEWKRRLLHYEVGYGEQRDLFSPAGLENIFRPPPSKGVSPFASPERLQSEDITMPSSPPPYTLGSQSQPRSSCTTSPKEQGPESSNRQQRAMRYRMADTGSDQFSDGDLSRSSSFHPGLSTSLAYSKIALEDGNLDDIKEESECRPEPTAERRSDRVASGYSDDRHEDLSPIFISRHNTVGGKIDYAALDLQGDELKQRLQDLHVADQVDSSKLNEEISQLLPANMLPNQEEFRQIGSFVNIERGGNSYEGSFRARMLSPSSLPPIEDSAMLQDGSIEVSTPKNFPHMGNKDQLPANFSILEPKSVKTSNLRPLDGPTSHSKPGTGSPLKLFGEYDTFTNQKLLRRLSQFESNLPEESMEISMQNSKVGESTNYTEMNEAYIALSSPSKTAHEFEANKEESTSRTISQFGFGQLNNFEFSDEPLDSSRIISEGLTEKLMSALQERSLQKGSSNQLEPSSRARSQCTAERHSSQTMKSMKQRVVTIKRSIRRASANSETSSALPLLQHPDPKDTPRKQYGNNESKRLLRSPPKNPTPKRRRTLHKAEDFLENSDIRAADMIRESHEQIQSIVGRKRKDARHGETQEPANAQVMAMRQILRPRTPTPSQRLAQDQKHNGPREKSATLGERSALEQEEKIARIQAELDLMVPHKTIMTPGASQPMHTESRKASVTTDDFLIEAKKIMAGIRKKARPSSGLASLEESESDNDRQRFEDQEEDQDGSCQESTKEPFSRPPSRDGPPLPRLPQRQYDPEVINHLRKYEEGTGYDDIIASSLKSLKLAKEAVTTANEIDRMTDETISRASGRGFSLEEAYQSEPSNIQITEYPELQRKRKHSTSSVPAGNEDHHEPEFFSQGSTASSGLSTGRSIPTGSSRGSDSRHIIAPHTVSHLIPQQLAGMVFDDQKKMWVKWKAVSEIKCQSDFRNEDSDDDPFGDIPDLTVDEAQELNRLQAVVANQHEKRMSEAQMYQKLLVAAGKAETNMPATLGMTFTLDDSQHATSSVPANFAHPTSSTIERAACPITKKANLGHAGTTPSTAQELSMTHDQENHTTEDVEQEISIHESRNVFDLGTTRRRNVTISFSSPLTSIIPPDYSNENSGPQLEDKLEDGNSFMKQTTWQRSSTRPSQQTPSRRLSLGGHTFVARPVSRIDEREEDALLDHLGDSHIQSTISVLISTPLPARTSANDLSIIPSSSVTRQSDGILELTPLADFTMNHPDDSFALEVSYVANQYRQQYSASGRRILSLSVKDLVQRITDVEPYEPFWEHMKQLELGGKNLRTLHMLSKFCSRLEDLDVSNNQIRQMDGVPRTIRHLQISSNCLSDLTSWSQMSNLQYIDLSNNGLTNLDGLKDLVHLRGLRADNNKIQSLDGIMCLDGLINLRLRNNVITTVDFSTSKLQRLTELDLKGNDVRQIRSLNELRSLTTLNLEDNDIHEFLNENLEALWSLKYLKLSGNKLEDLDVMGYPNLRLLYLDRNRLRRVNSLHKVKHLDSLSLREQEGSACIDPEFLNEAFEVRKLFLSGNLLTSFAPSIDFLNLQYLELANCGLETLPQEFGHIISNVRVLNLNFNALEDIRPLLGIIRLKKLHLAGNRLARIRRTTNVLSRFTWLTKVDLRNNPLTLGFYPLISERRLVVHDNLDSENEHLAVDPFTLEDGDRERDAVYVGRLDMGTKMRRRVFEILMLGGSARLKVLDGLLVDRMDIAKYDNVWEELVKVGVVDSGNVEMPPIEIGNLTPRAAAEDEAEAESTAKEEENGHEHTITGDRWPAEDSFA